MGPRGEYLGRARHAAAREEDKPGVLGEVRLRDAELRGLECVAVHLGANVPLADNPRLVQVAETREKRSVLATEIIKGVMLPQFVTLPLAVLLVWLALARGIKPLNQLEERIRARRPDDLSPLDDRTVPLEVAPLVSSVNDLLTRLKDSLATQKRFLADAAHQLKTPLAGLRMQADLAQRQGTSEEELKHSLQADRALQRARHAHRQPIAGAGPRRRRRRGAEPPALRHGRLTIEVVRDSVPARHGKAHRPGLRRCPPGAPT
jgi:two-component system sensor histidine kinase TctE